MMMMMMMMMTWMMMMTLMTMPQLRVCVLILRATMTIRQWSVGPVGAVLRALLESDIKKEKERKERKEEEEREKKEEG
jgi:hypothetical protein